MVKLFSEFFLTNLVQSGDFFTEKFKTILATESYFQIILTLVIFLHPGSIRNLELSLLLVIDLLE